MDRNKFIEIPCPDDTWFELTLDVLDRAGIMHYPLRSSVYVNPEEYDKAKELLNL